MSRSCELSYNKATLNNLGLLGMKNSMARGQCASACDRGSQATLVSNGWVTKIYYLEFLRASQGTLSRWFRLHLQSLAPTNPHRARVVGYGPLSIRKACAPAVGTLIG
jgi:hypothetical protein